MATRRRPAAWRPNRATTLRLALVDLGATPEDDTHGRFLHALRAAAPGVPLVLLADASAFDRRFAGLPARGAERRAGLAAVGRGAGRGLRRRWRSNAPTRLPPRPPSRPRCRVEPHRCHDHRHPEPGFAHQRRQDDAGAHAARHRRRRGARRAARDRVRRGPRLLASPEGDACACGTRPASATACGWRGACGRAASRWAGS